MCEPRALRYLSCLRSARSVLFDEWKLGQRFVATVRDVPL
jgi:hypothetical protein